MPPAALCAQVARAATIRGFSGGLERIARTPPELLSLVTLFRNTKESNAHPGRGKILIIEIIMPSRQRQIS